MTIIIMKKVFLSLILLIFFSHPAFTATGAFFNVSSTGSTLTISTTVPNHTYPRAGIKINSSGYNLTTNGVCTPHNNGYCLFSVSNTAPVTFTISGPTTKRLDLTLCLNGVGPLSCQTYSVGENFAYVANFGGTTVSLCSVNSNGTFSNCADSGGTGFNNPINIVLNAAGTFAYVTNYGSNNVLQCAINANTRQLSGCASTGPAFVQPLSIVFNPSETFAYVTTQSEDSSITLCSITPGTGGLSSCSQTANGAVFNPSGMALYPSGVTAYIINNYPPANFSYVSVCPVDLNTGIITSGPCFTTLTLNLSQGITINSTGTFAYISSSGSNNVMYCPVNPQGISACSPTANNLFSGNGPVSLSLSERHAYVPNANAGTVSICSVNARTGDLGGCVDSGVNAAFSSPAGIAFIR